MSLPEKEARGSNSSKLSISFFSGEAAAGAGVGNEAAVGAGAGVVAWFGLPIEWGEEDLGADAEGVSPFLLQRKIKINTKFAGRGVELRIFSHNYYLSLRVGLCDVPIASS